MLYTRKGDSGTTKTFACDQRISKSSAVAEALGALDETNSFLGLARARTKGKTFEIKSKKIKFSDLILEVQQNLFIVQAEVAGSTLYIDKEKIRIFYHFDKKDKVTNIKGVIVDKKTPLKNLLNYLRNETWDWHLINSKSGIIIFCDKGYYQKYSKELLTESNAYKNVTISGNSQTLTMRVPHGVNLENIHNENFNVSDGNFKIKHELVNKNNTGLQMTDIICGALRQKFINNNPIFIEPLKKRINNYKE